MSDGFNMSLGLNPSKGFTVRLMCGCRIIFGAVPLSEFGMLTHGFSKKALMAADIADRIGATFVIGEPADLDELRKSELLVSESRHQDCLAAHHLGLYDVAMWLRVGDRGLSSNAMCKRIFGVPQDAGSDHPHDPDDLRRCLLFLNAARAHDKVHMMADVSSEWSRLVAAWETITATFQVEMNSGKSAPKAYALMQEAIRNGLAR